MEEQEQTQEQTNDETTTAPPPEERDVEGLELLLGDHGENDGVLEGDRKPAAISSSASKNDDKETPTNESNEEEEEDNSVTNDKNEAVIENDESNKSEEIAPLGAFALRAAHRKLSINDKDGRGDDNEWNNVENEDEDSKPTDRKKRLLKPGGLKRGVKIGQKVNTEKTQADWFDVCEKYVELQKENPKLKKKSFLESPESGDMFTGTLSEQQSLGRYLRKFEEGKLKRTTQKRHRKRVFKDVEEKLWQYLDLRANAYKRARCGVSWSALQKKCLQFADLLGFESFQASSGWLSDTLREYLNEQSDGEPLAMDEEVEAEVQESIRKMEFNTAADRKAPPAKGAAAQGKGKKSQVSSEDRGSHLNSLDVEAHIRALQLHAEHENVPAETRFMLERFAQGLRMHSSQTTAATPNDATAALPGLQQQQDPILQPPQLAVMPAPQQQQPNQPQMMLPNLMQAQLLQQQHLQNQQQNPQPQNLPQVKQQQQQQHPQQQQQPQPQQQQPQPQFPNNSGQQMHPQQLPNLPNNLPNNLFQFFSQ